MKYFIILLDKINFAEYYLFQNAMDYYQKLKHFDDKYSSKNIYIQFLQTQNLLENFGWCYVLAEALIASPSIAHSCQVDTRRIIQLLACTFLREKDTIGFVSVAIKVVPLNCGNELTNRCIPIFSICRKF